MNDIIFTALSIAVIAAVTWLCRLAAFMIFGGKREIPKTVTYLGRVLPPAIMVILVFYCLRSVDFTSRPCSPVEKGERHTYDHSRHRPVYGAYTNDIIKKGPAVPLFFGRPDNLSSP